LLWACHFDDVACVRLLWEYRDRGVDISIRDDELQGPLATAAASGAESVMKFLLHEAKVDLEEQDSSGKTALIHSCMSGNIGCVAVLHSAGASITHGDSEGDTPLIWAAWQGHVDCLQYLIHKAGADVDQTNNVR
jgi:ankyrin repeat protein